MQTQRESLDLVTDEEKERTEKINILIFETIGTALFVYIAVCSAYDYSPILSNLH